MSRILPGERGPTLWYTPYGKPITTYPPQVWSGAVVRVGSSVYIRDDHTRGNFLCLSGFGRKALKEINRQLRHARQLTDKEQLIISSNNCLSFTSIATDRLHHNILVAANPTTGTSTYARDWTHPDLPGVVIVDTIRRVYNKSPARGPTILFFPGKMDMLRVVATVGPTQTSAIRAALEPLLPIPLADLTLDYLAITGFEGWLRDAAP